MPERDGKHQGEDIAQSKRARAGSLAIVEARTCLLRKFDLQIDVISTFSGVKFV